jgi:uncharacterized OB-fold protein
MSQTAKKQAPIREGLFEVLEDGAHLIGSRCRECGEVTFPANAFCPQCCTETTENLPLSRRGILYSFTVQRFKPSRRRPTEARSRSCPTAWVW